MCLSTGFLITARRLLGTAGLLALVGNCAAADWAIGPLQLHGLDGFEKVRDAESRFHLRDSSGVDVIVSVFSLPADVEAKKFGGDRCDLSPHET